MSLAFHIHDLKNKLSIVFFMLDCSRIGRVLNDEHVTAVYQRIDEILSEISISLKVEPVTPNLEAYSREDFFHFLQFAVQKLSKLYPEVNIALKGDSEIWPADVRVSISKAKL